MRTRPKGASAPAAARQAVVAKALFRAAGDWAIGPGELSRILGTSEATLYRLKSGGRTIDLDGKEGELALLFLRLYRSLDALVGGDPAKARRWLIERNRHLGGVPLEMLAKVHGLVAVADYVDAMRAKV